MQYLHRVLIGMTGAIGKMGPQSQIITNKVGFQIGHEVGAELEARGLLRRDMDAEELWQLINKELEIDPNAKLAVAEGGKELEIEIKSCNICPKKVGKYAIPGTACPVGGMFQGVAHVTGLLRIDASPDLTPGEICRIAVKVS